TQGILLCIDVGYRDIGHERHRNSVHLGHALAVPNVDCELERIRRSPGRRSHRYPRSSSCTFSRARIQHGIAEPVRAVPCARLKILSTGFDLQLYKLTAPRLRPHAINAIPALSSYNLRHLLPGRG